MVQYVTMESIVSQHLHELRMICSKRRVRSLALFGSAASGNYRKGESDLDFLVEFEPMPPIERARAFFALEFDLQSLFDRPVDLSERDGIRNRRIRAAIEASSIQLYAAA